jgi:hypothetical protein
MYANVVKGIYTDVNCVKVGEKKSFVIVIVNPLKQSTFIFDFFVQIHRRHAL